MCADHKKALFTSSCFCHLGACKCAFANWYVSTLVAAQNCIDPFSFGNRTLVENIKGTKPFARQQGCEVRAVIEVASFLHRAHPEGIGSMAALAEILSPQMQIGFEEKLVENPHNWKQHQTELCLRGVSTRVEETQFYERQSGGLTRCFLRPKGE